MPIDKMLHIIVIEDNQADFLLVQRHVNSHGMQADCRQVTCLEQLQHALDERDWDIVLSDYHVPGLDFCESLACICQHQPDLPLILLSGSIGEEKAVELLKQGLTDYILKDNPARLVISIERAMRESAERRARLAAEKRLEQNEVRFRTFFESSRDALMTLTPDNWKFSTANPATLEMFGAVNVDEFATLGPWELSPEIQPDGSLSKVKALEMIGVALQNGSNLFEWRHRRFSGEEFDAEVLLSRIEIKGTLLLQATVRDITVRKQTENELQKAHYELEQRVWERTNDLAAAFDILKSEFAERVQAEKALVESRSLLTGIIDSTQDMIWSVDPVTFGLRSFNRSLAEYFLRVRDLHITVGMRPEDLLPDEYAQLWHRFYRRALEEGSFTTEYQTHAHTNTLLLSFNPLIADGVLFGISVFGRDITVCKQAGILLQESENRYRTLVDNIPVGINVIDQNHKIAMVNRATAELYNKPFEWFVGRNCFEAFEKRQAVCPYCPGVESMFSGKMGVVDTDAVKDDGDRISVRVRAVPLTNPDGQTAGFVEVVEDITESKRILEDLKKKNAEIEQFLYAVSHDLRTPLVTVKNFLGYLEKDMSGNQERVMQDLQFIHGAADKMKLLLDELLRLARNDRHETPPVRVSYREIVVETLETLAGSIKETGVEIDLCDADLVLYGDRSRLFQIWQNLIENAIKYSRNGSIPRIEIGVRQDGGETVFFVRDNGIGIDPRYHGKVFEIFEKLDPESPGAGMGLSMIQRIIEKFGGRIWVESEGINKGSSFYFTLPLALCRVEYVAP